MRSLIEKILQQKTLTSLEAYAAMELIFSETTSVIQIGAFLSALELRGQTVTELLAFFQYLIQFSDLYVVDDPSVLDMCGTGGDGANTFNISTAAALLLASAGVKVAKHGGGAASSLSGSADVARELGISIRHNNEYVLQDLTQNNFTFLLADSFNTKFKKIKFLRKQLGVRTSFNLLGPLINPLRVRRQVIGVYHKNLLVPVIHFLQQIGLDAAMVVHADDGLDEFSVSSATNVAHLKNGKINLYQVKPEELGFKYSSMPSIKGGNAKENAVIIKNIFAGDQGPCRDVVVLNAAAGFMLAGQANSFKEGIALGRHCLDSGLAHTFINDFLMSEDMK